MDEEADRHIKQTDTQIDTYRHLLHLAFTHTPSRPSPISHFSLSSSSSPQMYAGQNSIEKTLALTQAIRDSQLRAIQNYHKQTFLPAAAAVATILTEQASALTSMGVELITKV